LSAKIADNQSHTAVIEQPVQQLSSSDNLAGPAAIQVTRHQQTIVAPPIMPQGLRTALLGAKHADTVRNLTTLLNDAALLRLTTLNSHMTRWCQCAP